MISSPQRFGFIRFRDCVLSEEDVILRSFIFRDSQMITIIWVAATDDKIYTRESASISHSLRKLNFRLICLITRLFHAIIATPLTFKQ